MNRLPFRRLTRTPLAAILLIAASVAAGPAAAQRSSLYQSPAGVPSAGPEAWPPAAAAPAQAYVAPPAGGYAPQQPGGELAAASWIHTPPQPARQLRKHDIVHIRVDETAQSIASGNAQSRKNASLEMTLSDWIRLDGLDTVKPAPQRDGDIEIAGNNDEIYRADSTLRTRQAMTFSIAAEIADIRPNGILVLSATKTIQDNDNSYELSLSGQCRPQDIAPDNTVLSRDIYMLKIAKNEDGHVREGYARGWFSRWYGKFKPF